MEVEDRGGDRNRAPRAFLVISELSAGSLQLYLYGSLSLLDADSERPDLTLNCKNVEAHKGNYHRVSFVHWRRQAARIHMSVKFMLTR